MLLGVSAEGGALSACDGVEGPREEIFGFFLGGIIVIKRVSNLPFRIQIVERVEDKTCE